MTDRRETTEPRWVNGVRSSEVVMRARAVR